MLPYFRKCEHYLDPKANAKLHGFNGPIHVTSVSASDSKRLYGLRDAVRNAFIELVVQENNDSSGSLAGISEYNENWHHGLRQSSSLAYSLKGVQVWIKSLIQRVVFSKMSDGKQVA